MKTPRLLAAAAVCGALLLTGCTSTPTETTNTSGRMGAGGGDALTGNGTISDSGSGTEEVPAADDVPVIDETFSDDVPEGYDLDASIPDPDGGGDPNEDPGAAPLPPPSNSIGGGQVEEGKRMALLVAAVDPNPSAAKLTEAFNALEESGYAPVSGLVSCDTGAAEALQLDPEHYRVGVYFENSADAEAFRSQWGGGSIGVADVTVGCMQE